MRDQSLGVQGHWHGGWGDHQLKSALSLRLDQAETEGETYREEGRQTVALILGERWSPWRPLQLSGALRLEGGSEGLPEWIPKLGLSLGPLKRLSLRANLGRLYRRPGLDELHFRAPGLRGNPDLRSESGWGGDLGLQYLRRGVQAELVLFGQRYHRLIHFIQKSAYLVEADDSDAAKILGLEFSASWRPRPLHLELSYTQLQAQLEPQASPLPYRPQHHLFARLSLQTGAARLFSSLDWRSALTTDRGGLRRLEGYTWIELGALGPVALDLEVGLRVQNALDQPALDLLQSPRPGRSLWSWLRWRL